MSRTPSTDSSRNIYHNYVARGISDLEGTDNINL